VEVYFRFPTRLREVGCNYMREQATGWEISQSRLFSPQPSAVHPARCSRTTGKSLPWIKRPVRDDNDLRPAAGGKSHTCTLTFTGIV
jgi:hypothetical protein